MLLQGETRPFKPYTHRYNVPHKASGSSAPFWYSIKRASAHIIVLASYSAFGNYFLNYLFLIILVSILYLYLLTVFPNISSYCRNPIY